MSGFEISSKIDWKNTALRPNKQIARKLLVSADKPVNCVLSLVGRHAEDIRLGIQSGVYTKDTFVITAESESAVVSEVRKSLTETGLKHYVHSGALNELDVVSLLNKLKGRKLDKLVLDYCGYPNILDLLWLNSISPMFSDNLIVSFTYLAAPQRHIGKPHLLTNLYDKVRLKFTPLDTRMHEMIEKNVIDPVLVNGVVSDIDKLAMSYCVKYVELSTLPFSSYGIELRNIWMYSDSPSNRMLTFTFNLVKQSKVDVSKLNVLRKLVELYTEVKNAE
jgi:hypothetical protein